MGWIKDNLLPILGIGGTAAAAYAGYKGTQAQNIASAQQAQKQMDFQERMSNTAHQRQMADMRKAGLNPILSAKYGGASSPTGQQAPQFNKAAIALQNASSAANIQNIMANTAKTLAETAAVGPVTVLGLGGASSAAQALSAGKDMLRRYGGLSGSNQPPNLPNVLRAGQPSNIFLHGAASILREMNLRKSNIFEDGMKEWREKYPNFYSELDKLREVGKGKSWDRWYPIKR